MLAANSMRRVQHAPLPIDDEDEEGVPIKQGFHMFQDSVDTRDDTHDIDDDLAAIESQDVPLNSHASIEEVSSHVLRSTYAYMQQTWKSHATEMDSQGKSFAQRVYGLHSNVVKEIAGLKSFELKPVTGILNSFTTTLRETLLITFSQLKRQDDEFTAKLYQATRRTFSNNLKDALEARDKWHNDKMKGMKAAHEAQLNQARAGAAEEIRQLKIQLEAARQSAATSSRAVDVLERAASSHDEALSAAAGATTHKSLVGFEEDSTSMRDAAPPTASRGRSFASSLSQSMKRRESRGTMKEDFDPNSLSALIPDPTSNHVHGSMATSGQHEAGGGSHGHVHGVAFSGDARSAIEDLNQKLEALEAQVQEERSDVAAWKAKWAQESTKTEGIKRECMQIVQKCEDHVRGLQQQHVSELSQRDYILQRCKDTILNLEARLLDQSFTPGGLGAGGGQSLLPAAGSLSRGSTPPHGAPAGAGAGGVPGTLGALNAGSLPRKPPTSPLRDGHGSGLGMQLGGGLVPVPTGYVAAAISNPSLAFNAYLSSMVASSQQPIGAAAGGSAHTTPRSRLGPS